jgi:cohesin complex subunit SA-1/2
MSTQAVKIQASQAKRVAKLQNSLLAEQRLCELASKLVLAVLGRMVNVEVVKQRLERNKTRLGHNFKLVLEHLDQQTKGKKGKGKTVAAATVKGGAQQVKAKPAVPQAKSAVVVVEDDEDEDADAEEEEEVVREREIQEDDEMADADNDGHEEGDNQEEVVADAESVLGD